MKKKEKGVLTNASEENKDMSREAAGGKTMSTLDYIKSLGFDVKKVICVPEAPSMSKYAKMLMCM